VNLLLGLPSGRGLPPLKATLTGEPTDLQIQIRLADFIDLLKVAVQNGGMVNVESTTVADQAQKAAGAAQQKAATKKAARIKKKPAPAGDSGMTPGTASHLVMTELAKGPASSLELVRIAEQNKLTAGSIYQATSKLKERGVIEGFIDEEGDGTRRWKLCQV
jgi:hypothetical protein